MTVCYAVFNDTESRDRALEQLVVGKGDGCFDVSAVGSREIRFNSGEDGTFAFYDSCEEDFVIEEREEN
jgi:hypothetical protein